MSQQKSLSQNARTASKDDPRNNDSMRVQAYQRSDSHNSNEGERSAPGTIKNGVSQTGSVRESFSKDRLPFSSENSSENLMFPGKKPPIEETKKESSPMKYQVTNRSSNLPRAKPPITSNQTTSRAIGAQQKKQAESTMKPNNPLNTFKKHSAQSTVVSTSLTRTSK